jgi:outer membrane protein assembly factor BamB
VQKGIVATAAPYAGYFLVTTADGNVRLIDSSTGVQQWRTTITGASAPLLLQGIGSGYVYVGSSTGMVYELALTTGTQTASRSVGGGSVVVGDPAYDGLNQKLYVSTSGGNLYAFSVPF